MKKLWLILFLLLAPAVGAQQLTSAQLTALKAAILADPALAALPNTPDQNNVIAAAFNATANPACVAYRSQITPTVLRAAILGAGAAQLDNLTQIKQQSLFFAAQQPLDGREQTIRAALDSFTGSANTLKASIQAVLTRSDTTRAEALFRSGGACTACTNYNASGACTSGSPAVTTYEGQITYVQVEAARALP